MLKAELRKKYLQKRKALSSDEILLLSKQIFKNFIDYFKPIAGQRAHIFIPIEKFNEIHTIAFIEELWRLKVKVYVPQIVFDTMKSVEITPKTIFKKNKWDILEPISPSTKISHFDFVITPLLYCDKNGNRVGYGKGFYDAFFENVSKDSKKIGVNYFNPEDSIDDVWENDITLDYLVTTTEVLSFFKGS